MPDDLTDHMADAIIGAIFLGRIVMQGTAKVTDATRSVLHGNGIPKDVTPDAGVHPYRLDPNAKPVPARRDARSQEVRRSRDRQATMFGYSPEGRAQADKYGADEPPPSN